MHFHNVLSSAFKKVGVLSDIPKHAAKFHKGKGVAAKRAVGHLLQHWKSAFIRASISEPEESIEHLMSASLQCSRVSSLRHVCFVLGVQKMYLIFECE